MMFQSLRSRLWLSYALLIGLVIYAAYGRRSSKLAQRQPEPQVQSETAGRR
jgi:hypothetical protein